MKAAYLLLLTLCWVSWDLQAGPRPREGEVERPASSSAGSPQARGRTGLASPKAHRSIPLPKTPSTSGKRLNPGSLGANQSVGPVKGASLRSQTARSALAARTSGSTRPAAPLFSNARHRSPNPALVGGSAGASGRNAAAINGSAMKRRP